MLEDRHGFVRLGGAAHEDVDRRIGALRPGVDRDVALGQHRDAGDPAILGKLVEVHVKQGRPALLDRAAEGHLDHLRVVEMFRLPEVENEMAAGVAQAVAFDEVVFYAVLSGGLTRLD